MIPEYKYKQIYNPKSNRFQNYDYGSNGGYFITICTKNRENYFGEIIDGNMILNDFGKIAEKYYLEITNHFSFVILDEFVIMPNHIHGIIIICNEINNNKNDNVEMLHCNISTNNDNNSYYSKISPKKGELGTIIRSFKSICTKTINKIQNKIFFAWQANYYDRIIRNEDELQRIRQYIFENPLKWELDKNNTENLFM